MLFQLSDLKDTHPIVTHTVTAPIGPWKMEKCMQEETDTGKAEWNCFKYGV